MREAKTANHPEADPAGAAATKPGEDPAKVRLPKSQSQRSKPKQPNRMAPHSNPRTARPGTDQRLHLPAPDGRAGVRAVVEKNRQQRIANLLRPTIRPAARDRSSKGKPPPVRSRTAAGKHTNHRQPARAEKNLPRYRWKPAAPNPRTTLRGALNKSAFPSPSPAEREQGQTSASAQRLEQTATTTEHDLIHLLEAVTRCLARTQGFAPPVSSVCACLTICSRIRPAGSTSAIRSMASPQNTTAVSVSPCA